MPPLGKYIDLHCERLQDGLFEEPINTLSNLFFFIVAYLVYKNTAGTPRPVLTKFFIVILIVIGTGSMTFHASARMWGALCDSIPIAIFALVYVFSFGKHIMRLGWAGGFVLIAFFIATYFGVKYIHLGAPRGKMPDGYVSMIPCVYFLGLLTFYLYVTKSQSAFNFLKITAIAAIAVFFRSADSYLCNYFSTGTHFLWHAFAALMVYLMVREITLNYHVRKVSG